MVQLLTVSYRDQLHKCHLHPEKRDSITIGNEWSDTVTFTDLNMRLFVKWNGSEWKVEDQVLHSNKPVTLQMNEGNEMHFYVIESDEENVYDIASKYSISFGATEHDDVSLHEGKTNLLFIREELGKHFKVVVNEGDVFCNFKRMSKEQLVEPGDQIFFEGVTIKMGKEDMQIFAPSNSVASKLTRLMASDKDLGAEYPNYHRSPRIIYREPEDKLTIAKPSSEPSKPSEHLAQMIIPPIVMIVLTVVVLLIQPRGIFIVISLGMTLVTIIISLTTYIRNLKKYRVDMKERKESYQDYLKQKTKELYAATEAQRHALHYHYPTVEQIRDMALRVDSQIYEKTMFHHDFLTFRVGLGRVDTSFEIQFNEEEFTQKKDELIEAARNLRLQFIGLDKVPIVTDLMSGPVGYIGHRSLVIEQLQMLVMQTALFHSYYDLQFITIFPEEEKEKWDWMRWLPHASLRDINVRGFVYHERSRDQVLNSLYQILKERKLALEEKGNSKEKTYFSPHYVVLITDEKLLLDHTVMEFFNEDPSNLGVSLVFVEDVMQSLPEHVKTVIDIRDSKNGNIILEKGELVNRHFTLDHFPKGFDKEDISRALAPLNHLQNLRNSIPESVTFLEMYGVEKVDELQIGRRWAQNETFKSLAVPLGLRGKDDLVNLNLHEKAHGPHGLVAGTTGSGKSEIIQSYILSLAVNFHPYEVAFLLIDYKGGGMANLFKNLPHLLGTITNLDGAQSMRALASIKAELQKRQRLFGEYDVNHINQYHKLYKQGKVKEPMPHLFLISDEFAELKSEQPDFMKELVSTARIGRSLGIHLILATQKPSGVVDDQIWSNSKFKLALKVQNPSDSNEILKTPDAAEITLPGRAYLQVGNNEIYELFQSAWSGADYIENKDDQEQLDATIYAINELGQYEILSEDLSGFGKQETITKVPSELDAVIDHIHSYAEQTKLEALPRPWLPPLEERVYLHQLTSINYQQEWLKEKSVLKPFIGFGDFPEMQDQKPLQINLSREGHMLVFSSPGYGKSTFLQTIVMDLVRKHNPENLHIYLMDFGTNGLLPLKDLPHVADLFLVDETEKMNKLIRLLVKEMKERKHMLSQYGVANLEMFEKASGVKVPNVLLVIDNYDSVRETAFVDEFEQVMTQIAREGGSLGMHLVISAGRQNALRMPMLTNIKTQISLFLIDQIEVRSIVGKTDLTIEDLAGRGLVKIEQPTLFQTALPTNGLETLEIIENTRLEAKEMNCDWKGKRPTPIPMMPEELYFEEFKQNAHTIELVTQGMLPIGLEFEDVLPLAINFSTEGYLLAVSDRPDGLHGLLLGLSKNITLLGETFQTMIVDTSEKKLVEQAPDFNAYLSEDEEIITLKNNVILEITSRIESAIAFPKWLILIADLKDFCKRSNILFDEMDFLLNKGAKVGVHFVIGSEYSYVGQSYEEIPRYLRDHIQTGILSMRLTDQDIFKQPYMSKEKYPLQNECYYVKDFVHVKIKLPK